MRKIEISLDEYFESGLPLDGLAGQEMKVNVDAWPDTSIWIVRHPTIRTNKTVIVHAERLGPLANYELTWKICPGNGYSEQIFYFTGPSPETENMFVSIVHYKYKELK